MWLRIIWTFLPNKYICLDRFSSVHLSQYDGGHNLLWWYNDISFTNITSSAFDARDLFWVLLFFICTSIISVLCKSDPPLISNIGASGWVFFPCCRDIEGYSINGKVKLPGGFFFCYLSNTIFHLYFYKYLDTLNAFVWCWLLLYVLVNFDGTAIQETKLSVG